MGNNAAFATFEATVIQLANAGTLTLAVLDALAAPYRGTDIDSGGCENRETMTGQGIAEVCVRLVKPDFVAPPIPTTEEWADPQVRDNYWGWWDEFANIRYERWGWR